MSLNIDLFTDDYETPDEAVDKQLCPIYSTSKDINHCNVVLL